MSANRFRFALGARVALSVNSVGDGTLEQLMQNTRATIIGSVSQWTIKRGPVVLLCCALLVILLVQVLPQVDLLDTAFHLGTAPIVIHSQSVAPPVFQILLLSLSFSLSLNGNSRQDDQRRFSFESLRGFEILHQSFRC